MRFQAAILLAMLGIILATALYVGHMNTQVRVPKDVTVHVQACSPDDWFAPCHQDANGLYDIP